MAKKRATKPVVGVPELIDGILLLSRIQMAAVGELQAQLRHARPARARRPKKRR